MRTKRPTSRSPRAPHIGGPSSLLTCAAVLTLVLSGCSKPDDGKGRAKKRVAATSSSAQGQSPATTAGGVTVPDELPPEVDEALADFAVDRRRGLRVMLQHVDAAEPAMLALFDSANIEEMLGALEFFRETGRSAGVAGALKLLQHDVARVRHSALDTLLTLEPDQHADKLAALVNDPDADVRTFAVQALREVRSTDVAKALVAKIDDADERVAVEAAAALTTQGELVDLEALLGHATSGAGAPTVAALFALRKLGHAAPIALLTKVMASKDLRASQQAVRAAGVGLDEARQALLDKALGDPRPQIRRVAVETLFEAKGKAARPALEGAIGDKAGPVRASALFLLAGLLDAEAATATLPRFFDDADPDVRTSAYLGAGVSKNASGLGAALLARIDKEDDTTALSFLIAATGDLRLAGAIDGHIDRLETTKASELKIASRDALRAISGEDFGLNAAGWRTWAAQRNK